MAATDQHDTDVPKGDRRRRIDRWLGLFLALQLLIPLTYYLRTDPYDERFAWRMFSAIRMHSCRTRAIERTSEGERQLALRETIHVAWIRLLRRNRPDVVRAFLARRCDEDDVAQAQVINHCVGADGSRLEPLVYTRDCDTGSVREPDELP